MLGLRRRTAWSCVVILAGFCGAPAKADVIRLKGGGELRGTFRRADKNRQGTQVIIRTLSGTVVTVNQDEITFATRRPIAVEQYESRRKLTADTVEGHWELSQWCRKNRLRKQREVHLRRIIELDPEHEKARRGLGHQSYDGQWMSRDEFMSAQGYVRYKGKYIFPQELELIQRKEQHKANQRQWYGKIKRWFGWANDADLKRKEMGVSELTAVTDPDAVPALVRVFRDVKDESARLLYVQILSQIEGIAALDALVTQSLFDVSLNVRRAAMKALDDDQLKLAIPAFVRALKSDLNVVVNRAATALAKSGDLQAVPDLIDALMTTHRYRVTIHDDRSGSIGFASDGSSMVSGPSVAIPPSVEIMLRTGQLPYGAQIYQMPTPGQEMRKTTRIIKQTQQNPSVLAALQKLTGADFAYDQRTWHLWWASK